ncbi:MAG: hypothetical protein ABII00_14430, partial [Elusimicrobiota bacterium]
GGSSVRRRRSRPVRAAAKPVTAAPQPAAAETEPGAPEPAASGDAGLARVAAAYAERLRRARTPPSRLNSLLNDIQNRTTTSGFTPEQVVEELKLSHGLMVDERGRVTRRR